MPAVVSRWQKSETGKALWEFYPWDLDLSFGCIYTSKYKTLSLLLSEVETDAQDRVKDTVDFLRSVQNVEHLSASEPFF